MAVPALIKRGVHWLSSVPRPPRLLALPSAITTANPAPNMVLLVTSDNEQFVVDKEVAERSVLIKNMLEGASQFSPTVSHAPVGLIGARCPPL